MTVMRGLWVPINTGNIGTTEVEARLAFAALFETQDGVNPRNGLLRPGNPVVVAGTAATGTMTYTISPINPVINRVVNEGVYTFSTTGTTTVNTTVAPVSNSRIDVIWVKQNDQSKGDADNLAVAGVTQGVAAASPVAPAIPTGAYALAQAVITSTTTATNTATITQVWRYTALRGTAIPVRSLAERNELSPVAGMQVQRMDLGPTALETRTSAGAWQLSQVREHAEFTGSIANTANALWGPGPLTLDASKSVNSAFVTSPANDKVALQPGLYGISCRYTMAAAASGTSWGAMVNDGNTVTYTSADIAAGYASITVMLPVLYLDVAQNVRFTFISGTGTTITTRVRVTRLG